MGEREEVRKKTEQNLKLSLYEKDLARKLKDLAKAEIARAKAKELLMKKELKLEESRKEVAEKRMKLVEKKLEIQKSGILKFSDEQLASEKNSAIYHENLSINQKEIAKINKKISEIEVEIAKQKVKLAEEKMDVGKVRGKLSEKQSAYVKAVDGGQPDEKVLKAKDEYRKYEEKLEEEIADVFKKEEDIKGRENKLADIKKQLSEKMAEREKIRHPGVKPKETPLEEKT